MTEPDQEILKLYRSEISGETIGLRRARIAVIAPEDRPVRSQFRGNVVPATDDDLKAIEAINDFFWGNMEQDVFGRAYRILDCENLVAKPSEDESDLLEEGNKGIAGQLSLKAEDEGFLHIVVIHVWPDWQGKGVGRCFLDASIARARELGMSCIKLGTTNDNIPAIYFYQRAGFVIEEVVPGEVADHHGIAPKGFAGIRIRDEIRLRLDL